MIKRLLFFLWELPQNIVAILWFLLNKEHIVKEDTDRYYSLYIYRRKGAVTLGKSIFMSVGYSGEHKWIVVAHEYGHTRQSRILGPLYLIIVGLPSLIWASIHTVFKLKQDYYSFYTERWANRLAGIYSDNGKLKWEK